MDKKLLKKFKRGNIVINAGLCLGSIAIFGFNPLALCFCYIGSDIALSLVDKAITNGMFNKIVKDEKYKESYEELRDYYEWTDHSKEILYALKELKEKQEKYVETQKELTQKQEEEERKRKEEERKIYLRKVKGLEDILNEIDSFLKFYSELIISNTTFNVKNLKPIYKEFLKLQDNLNQKPEACFAINGSLRIYINELIQLITGYEIIPESKKEGYKEKYKEITQEFLIYLQSINSQIESFSVTDTNLGLETLLNELKEINRKKDTN